MVKRSFLIITLLLILPLLVFAQDYATPESPSRQGFSNILGAGARALGMGGAFTAVADDATAASWNPAGLAQLTKSETSFVFDYFSGDLGTAWNYTRTYSEGFSFNGSEHFQSGDLNYSSLSFLSATFPFTIKDHAFVSQISYHRLSTYPTFNSTWVEQWTLQDNQNFLYFNEIYEYKQNSDYKGGLNAYSLSLATELFSNFRVGLSINLMDADITYNNTLFSYAGSYDYVDESLYYWHFWREDSFHYSFSDINFDFGLHWKLTDFISVGAVYHSKFTTDFEYNSTSELSDSSYNYLLPKVEDAGTSEITMPDGYSLGIAIHPTNTLTLALDYSVTNWSKASLDAISLAGFYYDGSTNAWIPAIFSGEDLPYPYFSYSEQKDTSSWRFGTEYVYILSKGFVIPFRAGYFREEQLVNYWDAGEPPTYDGFTVGTGLTYKRFQFDIAWVHTFGDEKGYYREDYGDFTDEQISSSDVTNNRLLASLIIRFD